MEDRQNQKYPIVQELKLNSTSLVADSTFRNAKSDPYPASFQCNLSSIAKDGKRIWHESILWSQAVYGFNRESMRLDFRLNGGLSISATPGTLHYAYLTPFVCYPSIDGNAANSVYLTAQAGTLVADLHQALTYPTLASTGAVQTYTGQWDVRYSPDVGIVIKNNNFNFVIEPDCPFIQLARNTHGFGVILQDGTIDIPYEGSVAKVGTRVMVSNSRPQLSPYRYVAISCRELTRHRVTASFSNVASTAFSAEEMGVYPVDPKYNGVFHQDSIDSVDDATVINLDVNDRPQSIRVQLYGMTDRRAYLMVGYNPWTSIIGNTAITPDLIATDNRGGTAYTEALRDMYKQATAAAYSLVWPSNICMKPDEIVHIFHVQCV